MQRRVGAEASVIDENVEPVVSFEDLGNHAGPANFVSDIQHAVRIAVVVAL
jgi:hypothetical protein